MTTVDALVVGAGPYGIAACAYLRALKTDVLMVGEPMESWRHRMPEGMFLKSEGFASNIAHPDRERTLAEFARRRDVEYGDYGVPVPIGVFRDYGLSLADAHEAVHHPASVDALDGRPGEFRAVLAGGEEVVARRVVIATGTTGMAHVPPELRELLGEGVSHSSEHVDAAALPSDVVIVGAGQSALELAALAYEGGSSPRVLVRRPVVLWNPSPRHARSAWERGRSPRAPLGDGWKLAAYWKGSRAFRHLPHNRRVRMVGETLGPAGAWWLRDRLDGTSILKVAHRVTSISREGVRLRIRVAAAGRSDDIYTTHLVAATGYRVDLEHLPFIAPSLRNHIVARGGWPILSGAFESSVRGLYFVGLPAALTFGPLMRFVCGTAVAADRVSRSIAGTRLTLRAQARAARPEATTTERGSTAGGSN